MDPHKTTLLYFIVNSLHILNELTSEIKNIAVDYILNNLVVDNKGSIQNV
jgi:hypothetical protein